MKKFLSSAVLAITLTFGFNADAFEIPEWGESVIMYAPNRVMDVLDIFSLSVGVGPVAKLGARVTRFITVGGGIGAAAKLVKGYDRQYGVNLEEGYNLDLLMFTSEKQVTHLASRFVDKIDIETIGAVTPNDRIYNFYEGSRDYWSIGVSAAAIAEVDFDLHIIEIFDLVAGIFFIDLRADDLDVYSVAGTREIEL